MLPVNRIKSIEIPPTVCKTLETVTFKHPLLVGDTNDCEKKPKILKNVHNGSIDV
jgi:hypothetical protein